MKPFKSIDEQLNLLKSRGIHIENDDLAKKYLLRNNYYLVVNCYSKFFIDSNDQYIPGTDFKEIIDTHIFDRELKSILLKYILEAEKHIKAIISYVFSEAHQEKYAYLIATNYNQRDILKISRIISDFSKTLNKYNKPNDRNSIAHYCTRHGDVPLWVLSNYLSFGSIVTMYEYMNISEQNRVAKEFSKILNENLGITTAKITNQEFSIILRNICDVRNILAHNNKLFEYKCKNNYPFIKELHQHFNIPSNVPKQDLYNTIIILYCLLEANQYAIMHNSILKRAKQLNRKIHTIDSHKILSTLGFPQNWVDITSKLPQ